jgi:hypothetical protein
MQQPADILRPLVGRIAWGVERGAGSAFHLEFGEPHLVIREPVTPRHARSTKAQRALQRRRVYVVGDWSLWVEYGDWTLHTNEGALDSTVSPGAEADQVLRDLDGQKLLTVAPGQRAHACVLTFDLGAVLEIWPSTELKDDLLSLHAWNGRIVSYAHDGTVAVEQPQRH